MENWKKRRCTERLIGLIDNYIVPCGDIIMYMLINE